MKRILFVFLFLFLMLSYVSQAQSSLNDYKYVIVPVKYDFLKSEDQYRLNTLSKFLFEKYGFKTVMDTEQFPAELANNRCLGLFANAEKIKSLFRIKVKINLKDCNNKVVFETKIGETKEKDFSKGYNLAFRDAFESFNNINYNYEPNESILAQANNIEGETEEAKEEIEALKKEIENLKKEKAEAVTIQTITKEEATETPKVEKVEKEVVQSKPEVVINNENTNISSLLYAQPKGSGYQLVDSTPKVVMVLLKTPKQNVYLVKGKNAIVYLENGDWYIAKENGEDITVELLPVKF